MALKACLKPVLESPCVNKNRAQHTLRIIAFPYKGGQHIKEPETRILPFPLPVAGKKK